MKNIFLTTIAAVFCGALTVSALDAKSVKVALPKGLTKLEVEPVSAPGGATISLAGKKDKAKTTKLQWQVINVPVEVELKTDSKNKDEEPDFVPAITFTVHLLMEAKMPDIKGKKVLLSKKLTYNDIPVGSIQGGTGTEMFVSLLLSPRNVSKLTEDKSGRLGKVLAVAVEAEDSNGRNCLNSGKPRDVVFDATLNANGKWWETKKFTSAGVELMAVNETPFAYWMSPTAPRVTTTPAAATGTTTTTPSTFTPTLPGEEGAETTPAGEATTPADAPAVEEGTSGADTPAAAEEDTKSGNKRKTRSSSRKTRKSRN